MKLIFFLVGIIFTTNFSFAQKETLIASKDTTIELNYSSSLKLSDKFILEIDTILELSSNSKSILVELDSKKKSIEEIVYPCWVKNNISVLTTTSRIKIIGRKLKVFKNDYPLIDD